MNVWYAIAFEVPSLDGSNTMYLNFQSQQASAWPCITKDLEAARKLINYFSGRLGENVRLLEVAISKVTEVKS